MAVTIYGVWRPVTFMMLMYALEGRGRAVSCSCSHLGCVLSSVYGFWSGRLALRLSSN